MACVNSGVVNAKPDRGLFILMDHRPWRGGGGGFPSILPSCSKGEGAGAVTSHSSSVTQQLVSVSHRALPASKRASLALLGYGREPQTMHFWGWRLAFDPAKAPSPDGKPLL